jgi:hypothetical protein
VELAKAPEDSSSLPVKENKASSEEPYPKLLGIMTFSYFFGCESLGPKTKQKLALLRIYGWLTERTFLE